MSKTFCPAGCGKRFISGATARAHADENHPGWSNPKSLKRKGWSTPHGFCDFGEPVTYEAACETMKAAAESFRWPEGVKTENGPESI